jgi:NADH-quinone oxidoreductase subunit A
VVLTILVILFGVLSFVASGLLAPRRPNTAKEAPYECGIVPSKEPPERFPVSFYVIAMLFIMFDIEIIFIYPYAVDQEFLGTYGLIEMLAFSAVFFVAFVYVVARGALDWGPLQRYKPLHDIASAQVPSTPNPRTTIRRVGHEGRRSEEVTAA